MLYCTVAPGLRPEIFSVASLVTPSLALLPVSDCSSTLRIGALRSTTKALPSLPAALVLPARSVWRTCTASAT